MVLHRFAKDTAGKLDVKLLIKALTKYENRSHGDPSPRLFGGIMINPKNVHFYLDKLHGYEKQKKLELATNLGFFFGYTGWTKCVLDYGNERQELSKNTNSKVYWRGTSVFFLAS